MTPAEIIRHKLTRRKAAYQRIFNSGEGQLVLADLRRYCRASKPTFSGEDTHKAAFLEGRRDVWIRIQEHLSLTDRDIQILTEDGGA